MRSLSDELHFARGVIRNCNELIEDVFHKGKLTVITKSDGTKKTPLDDAVSEMVVGLYRHLRVLSEEDGSTAKYGDNGIVVLDPVDGTHDLIAGQSRRPRVSLAGPSIGLWNKEPVVGVVGLPLLGGEPVIYSASKGSGAFRTVRKSQERLSLDSQPTKGTVLVTVKKTPEAQKLINNLNAQGFTPWRVDGAVFKACAVADPELLKMYRLRGFMPPAGPVVGFVSRGVHLHDVAAAWSIVTEAGGVATMLKNAPGKQPWIAANNTRVYELLKHAMNS
ncbi:MAG TPA: inositol monophosphatase family protein [Verrucomicrobiae bacterium]|nr:inositol monophosphatase family protein [Verrucomicrobiae bacterium]